MKAILPKTKFKNFYEKWNRKKLQSIAPLRGGFAFKSEKFLDSGIPIVRISNIKFDGTVGGEFEYYSKINSDEKFVLRGRSILLAMSGATTGKIAMLDSEEEYYQNQRVGYFQNTGAVNYDFLSSVLQTKEFTNQLNSVLVAGAQPNISSKEIDSFVFYIPESLNEQSAIGSLFRTLDDLLASYKDNLANYQSFKATMLSKMFPKGGQTVPEIRLDGFEGEWEEKKLAEIVDIIGGGTPDTNVKEYWNGEINWFSPTEVGNSIYLDTSEKRISELGLQKSSAKILPANRTILFTSRAGIGNVGIITKDSTTNQGFQSLVTKQGIDIYFLFSYSSEITRYALKHSAGSTFLEISGKELGKMDIIIPTYEEQQAIGSYFSNLDQLITSYQDKITQLETLKKKLLKDMFI
ncbi:restriction endonuclease subunit S [Streptococcus sp. oral taxon 431]|uniref:restriction endonuclease subunit S n=1 Tax=Streptococcus sp. oral taxon 431 TaxID=712633 RepID=UPI0035678732